MSYQHLLFQSLHMTKNDTEYHLQTLDKLIDKLEDRVNQAEILMEELIQELPALRYQQVVNL